MNRDRVAITTSADKAGPLAAKAANHGLRPVVLPCVEVTMAPGDVLGKVVGLASQADWILVTSSRAIESLWPDGGMPDIPVAAVGSSTADAVRAAGGRVAIVGDTGADAMVELLVDRVRTRSVFFPHATGADLSTVPRLEALGAEVTAIAIYESTPIGPASDPVDAALFGSPSAVTGWSRSRGFDDVVLGAIGPTTSSALSAHGHPPQVVPPHPDFALLIELMANRLRDRSHV